MFIAKTDNSILNNNKGCINNKSDFRLTSASYNRSLSNHASVGLQDDRPCPSCGESVEQEIFELCDFQFYGDENSGNRITHRVVKCTACDILYTNPCYTEKGFEVLFEKAAMSYGHTAGRSGEQCEWLLKRIPDCSSVLDFGCGDGAFLKSLPERINCIGVDANVDTTKINQGNVELRSIDYANLPVIPRVDVVTMFHVLEHIVDPLATLEYLREQTTDETHLLVEVPIIERAVAEQGQDIVGFFTVQHLTHFSKSSLSTMLSKAGWEIVSQDEIVGYNGYRVLARPGRLENSVKLDTADMVAEYLDTWRCNVSKIESVLARSTASDIVIWGAGQHTEYLAILTNLFVNRRQSVIVDSDRSKCGSTMYGIPVILPEDIGIDYWRSGDFEIIVSSYGSQDVIRNSLLEMGVNANRIICLYGVINRY